VICSARSNCSTGSEQETQTDKSSGYKVNCSLINLFQPH